jgi:hypothetical protein
LRQVNKISGLFVPKRMGNSLHKKLQNKLHLPPGIMNKKLVTYKAVSPFSFVIASFTGTPSVKSAGRQIKKKATIKY